MYKGSRISTFLLALTFPFSAAADSAVWKISSRDNHLYLGGTVHFLASDDYPLPVAFEQAYRLCTSLIFETDLQKIQDPIFQQTLMSHLSYPEGENLRAVLSPDTLAMLEKYLATRGLVLDTVVNYKPGLLVSMLTVLELQRMGQAGVGVDAYFNQKALQDNKIVGQLETVEQQLELLAAMGEGQENELIRYTLADMARLPTLIRDSKQAWREGDMQTLEAVALGPYRKEFTNLLDTLLLKRNNAWMPQIILMLESAQIEFILVGALHLVSESGLLSQLSNLGYKIEKL